MLERFVVFALRSSLKDTLFIRILFFLPTLNVVIFLADFTLNLFQSRGIFLDYSV